MTYARHFSTLRTPQSQPIPGRKMAKNNAGGYAFPVDDWVRLDRFLVLGAEGGTYYVNEKALSKRNADAVLRCIAADGQRVVNRTVEISKAGRAPKNDPAIFVLAMCASESCGADRNVRKAALKALPDVCRTFTHLAQFLTYTSGILRGRGRGLRDAIANWYNGRSADSVAYQMVKYRNREGWTHKDALRIAHPKPTGAAHNALYGWVTGREYDAESLPRLITAFEQAQSATSAREIIPLINDHNLTWEMVPNTLLNDPSVWEALLAHMPMMAMVRNLGKMTSVGLLKPMSQAAATVASRLDSDAVHKAKVHPLNILVALKTYQSGSGVRGSLSWRPVATVVDALDGAFYHAFGNVESTGRRIMLALDVSGSMNTRMGNLPLSCREAASAMAMVTARVEKNYVVVVFSESGKGIHHKSNEFSWGRGVSYYDITPRERLDDIVRKTNRLPFSGTDCALPMILATMDSLEVDAFCIWTDSETYANPELHPIQALNEYRNKSGIPAKMVTVGMVSNGFSIADPDDGGSIDVVGFDTATPQVISDFIAQ